jgi:hypothetical protein
MTFRRIAFRVGLVCLLTVCGFFTAATVFAADGEVGRAISIVPGVFVERDGARTPLALNDPVRGTDTITTDAAGRARILFHDDGAVTLGPDTSLALVEVLPEGKAPIFKAHVAQGLARFITGKIVEQNPKGFAVSTPEGTAGIRGTIFVLRTGNGQTTLYVVNATRDVALSGVSVPSGFKMTLPGGSPMPMTPQDVALTQSIAAAPPASQQNGAPDTPEQALLAVPDKNDPLTPTALANLGLTTQNIGDSLRAATAFSGHISGTLNTTQLTNATSWSGSFGFDVDLGSGAVSGATMTLAGILGQDSDGGGASPFFTSAHLVGGSGSVSGNSFLINSFSQNSGIPWEWRNTTYSPLSPPGDAWMNGSITQSGSSVTVSGTYEVQWPNHNPPYFNEGIDKGTFTGSN